MNQLDANNPLAHFDERATEWSHLYDRPQFRDRLQLFVNGVQNSALPGNHVLDYGCGTGTISLELAKMGYVLTAVDGAKGMVEQGKKAAELSGLENMSFNHIDPSIWQPAQKYDAIVCSSVIEYVPNDMELLHKFSQALNEKGWLLISVPTSNSLTGKLEDLLGKFKGKKRDVEFAQRRYNLANFANSLKEVNLETKNITYFEFPVLGKLGVQLSRASFIGVMGLIFAQKK